MNAQVEGTYAGGTYFFSTAQDPSDKISVYGDSKRFAIAMLNQSSPTLLTVGGSYANMREMKIEDVLRFTFPFGIGRPKCTRRTPISEEACLQHYLRLAMRQLISGDVC